MNVETFQHNGCNVEIYRDELSADPNEWSEGVALVSFHRDLHITTNSIQKDEDVEKMEKTHHIFKLYAYIHSGVTVSLSPFGCRWDSGHVGYVLVDKSIQGDMGLAKKLAADLTAEWDAYINGDVYGYRVVNADAEEEEYCGGYYDLEECRKGAKGMAERLNKQMSMF